MYVNCTHFLDILHKNKSIPNEDLTNLGLLISDIYLIKIISKTNYVNWLKINHSLVDVFLTKRLNAECFLCLT